jgi:hypothetical protein
MEARVELTNASGLPNAFAQQVKLIPDYFKKSFKKLKK